MEVDMEQGDVIQPDTICVGDEIDVQGMDDFLSGHGTYKDQRQLRASVCGKHIITNKLHMVQPIQQRYKAEVGDVVVGRVVQVGTTVWYVDLRATQEAQLRLSAVQLPGGEQRMRTQEDQLNMRKTFKEGDFILAEVQETRASGQVFLHTRTSQFGQIGMGMVVEVPSALVKRTRRHLHYLDQLGIRLVFGLNGYIWIQPARCAPAAATLGTDVDVDRGDEDLAAGGEVDVSEDEVNAVIRMAAAVRALASERMLIYMESCVACYELSLSNNVSITAMESDDFKAVMTSTLRDTIGDDNDDRRDT